MSTYNGVPMRTFTLPASKYPVKATYPMSAKGVTVHNTYNDATAENEINYMQRNGNYTSYHAAIDDIGVIFGVPLSRSSWHAGDGSNGYGNRNHLSFEICYSKNGGAKYKKAEANAVKVLAYALYINKWGMSKFKKHQDWSGKNCPHRILDEKRWGEFTSKVAKELARLNGGVVEQASKPADKPVTSGTYTVNSGDTLSAIASKHKTTIAQLQKDNNIKNANVISIGQVLKVSGGNGFSEPVAEPEPAAKPKENLVIDGYGGKLTIEAEQRYWGTPVDGVISRPSAMIRKRQAWLDVKVDGYEGPVTIKAEQKRYGTPADGVVSRPSALIKERQRRLNKGKL